MPPQMRLACEHLCAGCSDRDIARMMALGLNMVKVHLSRARARTGTHNRNELIAWCRAGGQVRSVRAVLKMPEITVRKARSRVRVDVLAYDAIRALKEQMPEELVRAGKDALKLILQRRREAADAARATETGATGGL